MKGLVYTGFPTTGGVVHIAWGPKGLLRIDFPGVSEKSFLKDLKCRFHAEAVRDDGPHAAVKAALRRYFDGKREAFAGVRIDLSAATAFERAVWNGIRGIPYGRTRSYGQLARSIGRPGAARAVGRACGSNPVPPVIPCHRVVGSTGKLVGYSGRGGVSLKKRLLDMEAGVLKKKKTG
ncbi:MAG: methylated-DNA--[protein]-cysteine S-methyltransferase [Candidatus Brocadiales bacterium]|nr:methylated-DNA--[protein]-cysteine S-methyltransferase [Candidatus Bathyanammoxibius sp.]